MLQGGAPDGVVVLLGELPERRIDQQLDAAGHEEVDGVGPSLIDLRHPCGRDATRPQVSGGTLGGQYLEAESVKAADDRDDVVLVVVVDRHEDRAREREGPVGRNLRLGERHPE